MATSVVHSGNFIQVTFATTIGDFDLQTFFADRQEWIASGLKVRSISMIPTATDDILIVRNAKAGADTASAQIFNEKATSSYSRPRTDFGYPGQYMWPAVDSTEVSNGVKMVIELE